MNIVYFVLVLFLTICCGIRIRVSRRYDCCCYCYLEGTDWERHWSETHQSFQRFWTSYCQQPGYWRWWICISLRWRSGCSWTDNSIVAWWATGAKAQGAEPTLLWPGLAEQVKVYAVGRGVCEFPICIGYLLAEGVWKHCCNNSPMN